ncbi:MAG: hypothetical protein ACE5EW_04310 [Thermoplasmata archaeon]
MVRYFILCPALDWQSETVRDRFEADRLMAEHVRREHPDWDPRNTFRRETAER